MGWKDDIQKAEYRAPSGDSLEFIWERVKSDTNIRGTVYNFAGYDGQYVQQTGNSDKVLPIKAIFDGPECIKKADYFESLLLQRGMGFIRHPIYGSHDVVPLGVVGRRDNPKDAGGESIVTFTLYKSLKDPYPSQQANLSDVAAFAIKVTDVAASGSLGDLAEDLNVFEKQEYKGALERGIQLTRSFLKSIADETDEASKQFNAINESLNAVLSEFIFEPITTVFQITQLVRAPARRGASLTARINGFGNLLNSMTRELAPNKSVFLGRDPFAVSSVVSAAEAARVGPYKTKTQALMTADHLKALLDQYTQWAEDSAANSGILYTGDSYNEAQSAIAATIGYLVDLSFSLLSERRFTLTKPENPQALNIKLYRTEEQFDFFVQTNDLVADEFYLLPKGREIVHYVSI